MKGAREKRLFKDHIILVEWPAEFTRDKVINGLVQMRVTGSYKVRITFRQKSNKVASCMYFVAGDPIDLFGKLFRSRDSASTRITDRIPCCVVKITTLYYALKAVSYM